MMYLLLAAVPLISAFPDGNSIPDAHDMLPKAKTCAQTSGCLKKVFTDADKNARCFGTYACAKATFETTNNVVCAGAATCYRATHSGLSPRVVCSGYKACERSTGVAKDGSTNSGQEAGLTSPKEVICQGFQTCTAMAGGIEAPVIRCDGDLACSNKMQIKQGTANVNMDLTAEDELFCNGKMACFGGQIEAMKVYCDGDAGCAGSNIQAQEIECHGKRVCASSTLNPAVMTDASSYFKLELYGYLAAAKSTISWPDRSSEVLVQYTEPGTFVINAYGYKSLARATIRNDDKPFRLNAYGYKATAGSSLTCSDAVPCVVNCKAKGCANLMITVQPGNDDYFKITPEECDTKSADYVPSPKDDCSPPKVRGTKCPYVFRLKKNPKFSYPQPCLDAASSEFAKEDAELDQEMEEDQSELDEYIEDLESDFEDFEWLKNADEQAVDAVFESYVNMQQPQAKELHVAALTATSSSTSSTLSTMIVSNLVTALSVITLLAIAFWCYAKHQANKGDYKGLPQ